MNLRGDGKTVCQQLRKFGFTNATFQAGVAELEEVLEVLQQLSPDANVIADMLIVRGLDYYTGTVFETFVPEYREIGSICSGGRYENLASYYTEQKLPGVGGSIGLTRLFWILNNYGLVQAGEQAPVDFCLIPLSSNEIPTAVSVADKLRSDGKSVDIVLTDKKLGDKLKYASKVSQFAVVIGEDEAQSGRLKVRDLASGAESELILD